MKKQIVLSLLLVCVGLLLVNCSGSSSPAPSPVPTGNYTLSGKVGNITSHGLSVKSTLPVTQIIAIGTDNNKYLADYNATTNTFSVRIVKGLPYALGFYNQSGGKITLLGYLKQDQVNWHSLPLMSVTGESTDVGTCEIDVASQEAVPSIDVSTLINNMGMNASTADLYGNVDGLMTAFTNVDVDNNGLFDFQETPSKAYMLQIVIGTGLSSAQGLTSGEVTKMLNAYNDSYSPIPNAYQIIFHAKDSPSPADGTAGTSIYPTTIISNAGAASSAAGQTWGSSAYGWSFMTNSAPASELMDPAVVPSGSYTFEVTGKGTYTFHNIQGCEIAAVGTTEGIIYPIFEMVTNEAGYLTTINYKWMINDNGTTREASNSEITAVLVDATLNTPNLVEPSPTIGVVIGPYPSTSQNPADYRPPLKITI